MIFRRADESEYPLIRRFGYGVPDYDRATASAQNHLALFAQAELRPFRFEKGGKGRKYGDCHYYDLPIPPNMLEELLNEEVELKITLSYFVELNPGLGANLDPQRYQSHGFRFDLQRRNEPLDTFRQRVNAAERENPKIGPPIEPDDDRWLLGPGSVSAESLHCDVWTGPAIELLGRRMLCVKPVVGWCRDRSSTEVCNAMRRYALIVTLKTANPDLDIYTRIRTLLDIPVETEIPG